MEKFVAYMLCVVLILNTFVSVGFAEEETDILRMDSLMPEFVPDIPEFDCFVEQTETDHISFSKQARATPSGLFDVIYNGSFNNIQWTLNATSGVLTITGSGEVLRVWYYNESNTNYTEDDFLGPYIKTINIQGNITGIGAQAFANCTQLTSINIPNTVTSIGEIAFYNCESLATINMPSSLCTIGAYAFLNCLSLQSVMLPAGVTIVDEGAFANCTEMKRADVFGDIGTDAFNNCISLTTLSIANAVNIGDRAFAYCEKLASIALPATVRAVGFGAFAHNYSLTRAVVYGDIGASAFHTCSSLKDITINEGCSTIGDYALAYCTSLESLNLPQSLQGIGEGVFYNDNALTALTLPDGIEELPNATFAYCTGLQSVSLPNTITSIGGGAFGCCENLNSINLPDGLTSLGEQAFYGCINLTAIRIPEGVTNLLHATFYQCNSLRNVILPKNLATIDHHAFAFCENLEELVLPSSITQIGQYAFANCVKITSLALPNGIEVLPDGALANCEALSQLSLPENLQVLGEYTLHGCKALTNIEIPNSVHSIGEGIFARCSNLKSISLPAGITLLPTAAFLLCEQLVSVECAGEIESIGMGAFGDCQKLTDFSLQDTIESIGDYAFLRCYALPIPSLPVNLIHIGEGAFGHCTQLQEANLNANISYIGDMAFSGCTNLYSLVVDSANSNYVTVNHILYDKAMTRAITSAPKGVSGHVAMPDSVIEISSDLFMSCTELTSVRLPSTLSKISNYMFGGCTNLQTVELPGGVTEVGEAAFFLCERLKNIDLGSNVTSIGERAFIGCSSLEHITFSGSLSVIADETFCGCESLTEILLPASVTAIGKYAFADCYALRDLSFPTALTSIGEYAFANCQSFVDVRLPQGVKTVGEFAFGSCTGLATAILPQSLGYVSYGMFSDCINLEQVELLGTVSLIGKAAFINAQSLERINFAGDAPIDIGAAAFTGASKDLLFYYDEAAQNWTRPEWIGPDGVTYQTATFIKGKCGDNLTWTLDTGVGVLTISGTGAMYDWDSVEKAPWHEQRNNIRSVAIEQGVTSIGSYAFMSCNALENVSIPAGLTTVGFGTFAQCERLQSVSGNLEVLGECMFYNCAQLMSIAFGAQLADIPAYAFYGCWNLGEADLPSTVKSIGEGAFGDCISMKTLIFQDTVETVGNGAFFNCNSLSAFYLNGNKPASIGEYAFYGLGSDLQVYTTETDLSFIHTVDGGSTPLPEQQPMNYSGTYEGGEWKVEVVSHTLHITGSGAMPDYAENTAPWLAYKSLFDCVIIEEGITHVGNYAFADVGWLTSITLPNSVRSIGQYTFAGCTVMENITLPDNLTTIGVGAFSYCYSLRNIYIPSSVSKLPAYCFLNCMQLESVSGAQNVNTIDYGAFYFCSELKHIDLPDCLSVIDDWAFAACMGLSSISIPGNVDKVGDYAFFYCSSLKDVTVNNGVSSIGQYAFSQTAILSISLPNSFDRLEEGAFELCEDLSAVDLGNTEVIGSRAFYGCTALETISLNVVSQIDDFAFAATGLNTVCVGAFITELGDGVFADCQSLEEIISNSVSFESLDGVLYKGDTLRCFPAGKAVGGFALPEDISNISPYAFYGCRRLVNVDLGMHSANLGEAAFAFCEGLREVVLGESIMRLPTAAFANCTSLEKLHFTGDAPTVIDSEALISTSDTLVFEYLSTADNWTEGTWTGPDGKTYQTVCCEVAQLTSNSAYLKVGQNGHGQISILLTNESGVDVTISAVTTEHQSIALILPEEPVTVPAGGQTDCIGVRTIIPVTERTEATVVITYGSFILEVPVTLIPYSAEYALNLTQPFQTLGDYGMNGTVQAINNSGMTQNAVILYSLYGSRDQLICAESIQQEMLDNCRYAVYITARGDLDGCYVVVYLLDGVTFAPLCQSLVVPCSSGAHGALISLSANVLNLDAECPPLPEIEIPDTDIEYEFGDEILLPASFMLDVNAAPADADVPMIAQEAAGIVTLEKSGTTQEVPLSSTTLILLGVDRVEVSDEGEMDKVSNKLSLDFSISDSIQESLYFFSTGVKLLEVKASGEVSASVVSASVKDGFKPPEAEIGGKVSFFSPFKWNPAGATWRLSKHTRLNIEPSIEVGTASASGDLSMSTTNSEVVFDTHLGTELTVVGINGTITLSNDDTELVSITLGAALGDAIKAEVASEKGVIKLGVKAGKGVRGNVSASVNLAGIVTSIVNTAYRAQLAKTWNTLKLQIDDTTYTFRYRMDEDGNILDLRIIPEGKYMSQFEYGDAMCKAALPASNGGTEMPIKEVPPPAETGNINTQVPQPTLSQTEISHINQIYAALTAMGVPHNNIMNALGGAFNFDTFAWINGNPYMTEFNINIAFLTVSARPLF